MKSATITSRHNPLILKLKEIRDAESPEQLFLEGRRLAEEALRSKLRIETLVIGPDIEEADIEALRGASRALVRVDESVLKSMSELKTPPGIIVFAQRRRWTWDDLEQRPRPIVILDGVQDPGNAAAIIRTAEAAEAGGIVTTTQTARLFTPKALRGAMGSSLRLPVLEHQAVADIARELSARGYHLAAASGSIHEDVQLYTDVDWTGPWAIVLGQEGKGVSEEWGTAATRVRIPMQKPVESLNVGAAAAVILYEAQRQRRATSRSGSSS